MKTLFATLLIICIVLSESLVFASGTLTSYKYIAKNMPAVSSNDNGNLYSEELNRVELHLYHKIYPNQTLNNRLGRIERTVFHQTYPSLTYSERVNNILSCYQDVYNMKNYVSNYYSPNLLRRLYHRYNGYPTGFTPPIHPSVIDNSLLNGYNHSYINNGYRGYRYNSMPSPFVGAGVRILD